MNCAVSKKGDKKYGLLPPKPTPEIILWHTLCIDLVGPYKFGNPKKPETYIEFHCMTMIDPATGFFDVVDIGQKTADVIAKRDLDEFFGFQGVLVACRKAMNSTVHTTCCTPI